MTQRERLIELLDSGELFLRNRSLDTKHPLNEYDVEALTDIAAVMDEAARLLERAIVPPCKAGDILYYFPDYWAKSEYEPEPISVEEVNSYNGVVVVECYLDPDTRVSVNTWDFGKTVFLTREQAEEALGGTP